MRNITLKYMLYLSFLYLINSYEAVSFQLYYKKSEEPIFSYLYTTMKVGVPETSIYTYISSTKLFSMTKELKTSFDKELPNYYDITTSNTFQNISCLEYKFVTSDKDIHAKEKFIFNSYNNRTKNYKEKTINELDFVLGVKLVDSTNDIYYLNIGFPVIKTNNIRDKFNLILQLKENNIIEEYDWFIFFEQGNDEIVNYENLNNLKPTLIIGGQPHYYRNDLFYKSQLITQYTDVSGWLIEFKDVYFYFKGDSEESRKVSTYINTVEIFLEQLVIYASSYYTNAMKREFFNKYDACHEVKGFDITYYCDKSEDFGIEQLKNFPSLYLEHNGFNYIFELSYKELFIENDGKYIFLVSETSRADDKWYIGFPLLKKYQFVFNQDFRTIGFYNPDLPKEKEIDDIDNEDKHDSDDTTNYDTTSDDIDDGSKKNRTDNEINNKSNNSMNGKTVAVIVVSTAIFFIVIGLLIGYFIFKSMNKRKRANELKDDNYDYDNYDNENDIN